MQNPTERRAMVMTVGTGTGGGPESLASALAWSIQKSKVSAVTFIVTDDSKITATFIKCLIRESNSQVADDIQWRTVGPITSMEDVNPIFTDCRKAIHDLESAGFSPDRVIVNYTSGTKAMSAAAALAGSSLGCELLYVSGDRDPAKHTVIPGTERPFESEAYTFQAHHDLQLARRMLELLQFDAAKVLCKKLGPKQNESNAKPKLSQQDEDYRDDLHQLATAYDMWDKFQHADAAKQFASKELRTDGLAELTPPSDMLYRLEQFGSGNRKADVLTIELLADLLANADRRMREGKWDDAVARYYRSAEMIAQIRLYMTHNINTSNVDLTHLNEAQQQAVTRIIGDAIVIALELDYKVLDALEPGFGWPDLFKGVNKRKQLRNVSILAHGTEAITSSGANKFKKSVLSLAREVFPEIDDLIRQQQFVWL